VSDEAEELTVQYQAFNVAELEKAQGTQPYREFLRRDEMSLGLYRLPVDGIDSQLPHAVDEVYVVLSGRAVLQVEDQRVEVGPGSIVSVEPAAQHRFTQITETLTLLVVFAPPAKPET
jgi:mannose-6-phosphate isomerase-like protein (cupin superfamily)